MYTKQDEKIGYDVDQLTRLQSEPHKLLRRRLRGKSTLPISPVEMLAGREANFCGRSRFSSADSCHVLSRYLPKNGCATVIDETDTRCYASQFSHDGSLFVAGFEGSHIRIYDVHSGWNVRNCIRARGRGRGFHKIIDTSVSPDNRFLVYANLSPVVHIDYVGSATEESAGNTTEIHKGLNFLSGDYGHYACGIYSVKFSTDGRELVAASNDASIYVYDLVADRLSIRVPAHRSYVMTACFADESGHIIYSGSDDGLCKVWDKRCLLKNEQASGVLVGHLDGVTFIDSRGDGRHLISNARDHSIKLWDIRKISSNLTLNPYKITSPWNDFDDISLATYRGHEVCKGPIRCYFSPARSTGQKYIYTGSSDSSVYIYDLLSGAQVAKLNFHEDQVRDCSWHPYFPMLVSSSFDGVIAKWDFSDVSLHQETDSV